MLNGFPPLGRAADLGLAWDAAGLGRLELAGDEAAALPCVEGAALSDASTPS